MQSSDKACGGVDKDGTVTKCVQKFLPEKGCVDTTCPHFATITDHADDTVKHYLQTLEIADGNEAVFVINQDGELEQNDGGDGVKYAVNVGDPDENNTATLTVTNNDDSSDNSIDVTGVTLDMAEVNHQVKIVSTTTATATTATASTITASTITVTTGTNTTATTFTATVTNMDKTFSFQLNMDMEGTDGDILRKTIGEQLSTMMGGMNASEIIAGGTDAINLKPGSIVASFETVTKVQKAALEDDVTTLIVGVVKQYKVNYKLSLITTLEPVETTASSAPRPSDAADTTAGEDAPTTVAATEAPTTTNAAAAAVDNLDEDASVDDIDAAQEALKADADKKKADADAAAKALKDMADSADTDVADAITDTQDAADAVQAKVDEAQKVVDIAKEAAKAGGETAKEKYKEALKVQAAALDEQETVSVQANAIAAASETKKVAEAATASASDAKVADNAEVQNKKSQVDDAIAKVAAALKAVSKASTGSVADKKAANAELTKANKELETSSVELNDAVTEASTANQWQPGCTSDDSDTLVNAASNGT